MIPLPRTPPSQSHKGPTAQPRCASSKGGGHHRGSPARSYNAGKAGLVDRVVYAACSGCVVVVCGTVWGIVPRVYKVYTLGLLLEIRFGYRKNSNNTGIYRYFSCLIPVPDKFKKIPVKFKFLKPITVKFHKPVPVRFKFSVPNGFFCGIKNEFKLLCVPWH